MNFDENYDGPQGGTDEDRRYQGARFSEIRNALYSTRYYSTWGGPDEPPLPVYPVTLGRALAGVLPFGKGWGFQQAAQRTVDSAADMRWGSDGRGFRRILHPNGICLMGRWVIDEMPDGASYTGYFKKGSEALLIGRYSTCCTETRRGRSRSLALVGKLFPTTDPHHREPLRTVNFFTQEDFGGAKSMYIDEAELRNAPNTTPWRRRLDLPLLLLTGLVLLRADKQPTFRQLYPIAELGKSAHEPTSAPEFMRLAVAPGQERVKGKDLDFRDEILAHIYDPGDAQPKRTLTFNIEVSDEGRSKGKIVQKRTIRNWKRVGRIVFDEAVASYNGDFVIHFRHHPWRNDRNEPSSLARPSRQL